MKTMKAIAVDAFQTTEHAKRSTLIARIIAQKQFVKSIKPPNEDGYCWYEGKRSTETAGTQTGLICTMGGAIKGREKTSSSDSLIKRASKQQPSMRCKGILDTWNNNVFAAFSVYVRSYPMDKNGCVRRFICAYVD